MNTTRFALLTLTMTFLAAPAFAAEVKVAGSWKTAFVFANGEQEGVTLLVDERDTPKKTPGS